MNTPKRPDEPPTEGAPLDSNPTGTTPNGIPEGMEDHEATGLPHSERDKTETAPNEISKG